VFSAHTLFARRGRGSPGMSGDSLEVLWRGADPAKFTALQAALRDEGIQFWQTQVYDPAGGFLNSRPYYLEAVPGFEIRVHSRDLVRAQAAMQWVDSKKADFESSADSFTHHGVDRRSLDADRDDPAPPLPSQWDSREATSEVWAGEDEAMAEYLASALRENGIPSRIPDEQGHRARLCVRPQDIKRSRDIVRDVVQGKLPE
jgi:hypothetical protein